MEKQLPEKYLIAKLKEAIKAEKIAGCFYGYISDSIKDNRIKDKFKSFAKEEAVEHKNLLNERLRLLTGKMYDPDVSRLDSDIKSNRFSIICALRKAKSSEKKAIKFYEKAKTQDSDKYRAMYEDILENEKNHWLYLDQEMIFIKKETQNKEEAGHGLFSFLRDILK
ncbi:MAG: hypothetical protein COS99_07785 [Candidatus Omnitrophica bacterium CG07_land_8_20_14_0_80_42_15]|uniref:Rubrerythrin diiron-binding domain-containing protein n=1 Tax=Candidatus Aquitaenariimonas noxiae TaxID=1974741 RepID=A0A2J0L369_9BACT|nr:MAG: hypothetical protein COS99_07785 [Candidatus Omnitrophica bacterium CG07_land_8_20_14_0_80_42_15]